MSESLNKLRDLWEETSDRLELLQTAEAAVREQVSWRAELGLINYAANFSFGSSVPRSLAGKSAVSSEFGTTSFQNHRKSRYCVKRAVTAIGKWPLLSCLPGSTRSTSR